MDELCRDLVKPILDGSEHEPEVEAVGLTVDDEQGSMNNPDTPVAPAPPLDAETSAASTAPVKTKAAEVRVKAGDVPSAPGTVSVKLEVTDQESIDPPIPSMTNSLCSETAPKIEEHSQPGPSCLPPQPWEYVIVARDEEHAPIEELLNCLGIEELQPLVKSLKAKCASKRVSHL